MSVNAPHVIVCGTDPESALGGIGVVMSGYLAALESQNISHEMLPTYRPGTFFGKFVPWLSALPRLVVKIFRNKQRHVKTVVYTHTGAFPSMARECVTLAISKLCGARTVIHTHSTDMERYLKNGHQRVMVKALFAPADAICALTPWWAERLVDARIRMEVAVVPNPIPPQLAKRASRSCRDAADTPPLKVLTMARLVPGKGADVAIRAVARMSADVRLIIAGDGPEKPGLEQLAAELNVEHRVKFAGWVSGKEKVSLLESADVFCLPSTYDVFPMSVVEAFCFGVPVVASNWGGIPDLVDDGRVGYLTEPNNPRDVARRLETLADWQIRQRMSTAAKRHVLTLCSAEAVGTRLREVFTSVTQ